MRCLESKEGHKFNHENKHNKNQPVNFASYRALLHKQTHELDERNFIFQNSLDTKIKEW